MLLPQDIVYLNPAAHSLDYDQYNIFKLQDFQIFKRHRFFLTRQKGAIALQKLIFLLQSDGVYSQNCQTQSQATCTAVASLSYDVTSS